MTDKTHRLHPNRVKAKLEGCDIWIISYIQLFRDEKDKVTASSEMAEIYIKNGNPNDFLNEIKSKIGLPPGIIEESIILEEILDIDIEPLKGYGNYD